MGVSRVEGSVVDLRGGGGPVGAAGCRGEGGGVERMMVAMSGAQFSLQYVSESCLGVCRARVPAADRCFWIVTALSGRGVAMEDLSSQTSLVPLRTLSQPSSYFAHVTCVSQAIWRGR